MGLAYRLGMLRHHLSMVWPRYRLSTGDFRSGLGQSAWLLHGLVRSLRPDVVVEIGSARGWSTCHIALALRENVCGRLYAVDPHAATEWNDAGDARASLPALRRHLAQTGLGPWVEIVRMTSADAAKDWVRPIDLLFIDGDHSYAGVKADWELFSPHLSRFGVAVFHDACWDQRRDDPLFRADMGVPRFLEELRSRGYPIVTIDRDFGVSLVQRPPGGIPLSSED